MNFEIPDLSEFQGDPTFVEARMAVLKSYEIAKPDFNEISDERKCQKLLMAIRRAVADDVTSYIGDVDNPKTRVAIDVEVNGNSTAMPVELSVVVPRKRLLPLPRHLLHSLMTGAYSNAAAALEAMQTAALNGDESLSLTEVQQNLFDLQDKYRALLEKWAKRGNTISGS